MHVCLDRAGDAEADMTGARHVALGVFCIRICMRDIHMHMDWGAHAVMPKVHMQVCNCCDSFV